MRNALVFPLLLFACVSAGCVAAGAAAGGAAGARMAQDEARMDLEYWLKTHDTTTRIGQAMKEERFITGMKPTHVKLVMDTKRGFDGLPTSRDTSGTGTVWLYERQSSRLKGYKLTFNSDRKLESVERTEPECENPSMTGAREEC